MSKRPFGDNNFLTPRERREFEERSLRNEVIHRQLSHEFFQVDNYFEIEPPQIVLRDPRPKKGRKRQKKKDKNQSKKKKFQPPIMRLSDPNDVKNALKSSGNGFPFLVKIIELLQYELSVKDEEHRKKNTELHKKHEQKHEETRKLIETLRKERIKDKKKLDILLLDKKKEHDEITLKHSKEIQITKDKYEKSLKQKLSQSKSRNKKLQKKEKDIKELRDEIRRKKNRIENLFLEMQIKDNTIKKQLGGIKKNTEKIRKYELVMKEQTRMISEVRDAEGKKRGKAEAELKALRKKYKELKNKNSRREYDDDSDESKHSKSKMLRSHHMGDMETGTFVEEDGIPNSSYLMEDSKRSFRKVTWRCFNCYKKLLGWRLAYPKCDVSPCLATYCSEECKRLTLDTTTNGKCPNCIKYGKH